MILDALQKCIQSIDKGKEGFIRFGGFFFDFRGGFM